MKYLVYQAKLIELDGSPMQENIQFCCSNIRLVSLLEEIDRGKC